MKFTKLFYEQYKIHGTALDQTFYIFRPVTSGFYFYDILSTDPTELDCALFPITSSSSSFASPISFEQVFDFQLLKSQSKMKFFRPVPPPGFTTLGLVCAPSIQEIPANVLCIKSEVCDYDETAVINCFQPFGQFLELFRTKLFNFDLIKPKSLYVKQEIYQEVSFLQAEQTDGFSIQQVLPLQNAVEHEEFEPQQEFDPAQNLKIIQQQQQFAAQLKNQNIYELFSEIEGEFIQSVNHFELIGVQSLNCAIEGEKEEYLYVYKPIAPPGYVALGITVSKQETPEFEVFCVKEEFVMYTSQAETLGTIYDQQTAIFIKDIQNKEQFNVDEKIEAGQEQKQQPQMKQIEVVMPKQGQYLTVKSNEYPILRPEFVAMLKCQDYGSQKFLIKSFHIEPQQELVCELEYGDQLMQIFRQILKKKQFNYFNYYYRLRPITQPRIQQEIATMTAFQKSLEPQKEVKADKQKKPDSQATNATELRAETINIPLELQLVDTSHGFDSYACSQPSGYKIIQTLKSVQCEDVHFIELIAPNGYEALSNVVHIGDIANFNKDIFICVAKIYLNEFLLIQAQKFGDLQLKQLALPVGSDDFYQSQYKPLYCSDKCFLIRDSIQTAYFQAEIKNYTPKFSLSDHFDKRQMEAMPKLKNMVEEQCASFYLNDHLNVFNPVSSIFGSFVTESMDDIAQDEKEIQKFFTKFLVCDDFSKCLTGLLAHPTGFVQLKGEINGQKCFKAVCPAGFVALGDYIGPEPQCEKFVVVNESIVQYKFVNEIEWLLTGMVDTDGIYVFQHPEMFKLTLLYEDNDNMLKIPVLNVAFLHYLVAQQTGYYMQDEQSSMHCPRSFLNYLQNYCTNNKTTINQQKLFDYGIHSFDGNCVLDTVLQQKKCSMVSLAQFKLFSTEQRISSEMAKTYLSSQKQSSIKKEFAPLEDLDKKLLLVDSLIEIMLSLDFGKDLIQTGRPNFFSMKIRRQQEGGAQAVEKIRLGKQNEAITVNQYPYEGYIIVSDKIPISTEGSLLSGRPMFFQLILKCLARIVGGYKQLFEMECKKIVELIVYTFGFRIGGKEVFTLTQQEDGTIVTLCDENCDSIIIGV
uniref:Uncharacterized protein n=1 Tax=Trepomonas sp. PC1 TaxID=1076344 RepID=A0A146K5S2_9EUKA|eukprot:JAP91987.1 hypothetical protein TPC1_16213 [Trepomonas sp. PC1]